MLLTTNDSNLPSREDMIWVSYNSSTKVTPHKTNPTKKNSFTSHQDVVNLFVMSSIIILNLVSSRDLVNYSVVYMVDQNLY